MKTNYQSLAFIGFWSCMFLIGLGSVHAQNNFNGLVMTAEGNQPYCSLTQQPIVSEFSISDPNIQETDAIYIQIVSGYEAGLDKLELDGFETLLKGSWNPEEAKLTIRSVDGTPTSFTDLEAAVKSVLFYSSSPIAIPEKTFSITLGNANYLPSTEHYYEFIASPNISWKQAREQAKSRNYYGLQGYLATITQMDEAILLGELSTGVGWIGGSDEAEEGIWKWMDGPEANMIFWEGGVSGQSSGFSYWNQGEPNNFGDEDYAHITDPLVGMIGSWNDLPNNTLQSGPLFQAKGFIVEYGGMPGDPVVKNSASTKLFSPEIFDITDSVGCEGDLLTLSIDTNVEALNWYDAANGGNLIHTGKNYSAVFDQSQSFWLDFDGIGCALEERVQVEAQIFPFPILLEEDLTVEQCDNDGINDGITAFNLNALGSLISQNHEKEIFEFYTDPNYLSDSQILSPTLYRNQAFEEQLFVKILTPGQCYEESRLTLKVAASDIQLSHLFQYETCETEIKNWEKGIEGWGVSTFDSLKNAIMAANPKFLNQNISLSFFSSEIDAALGQNKISLTKDNDLYFMQHPYLQPIYGRVDNLDLNKITCLGIGQVAELIVHPLPEFSRLSDFTIICENKAGVALEMESLNQNNYTYEWFYNGNPFPASQINTGAIQQSNLGGGYEVVATKTDGSNCTRTLSFTLVPSNVATITQNDLTIVDLEGDTGSLEVQTNTLGIGDYEFALYDPNGPYQNAPYFSQIPAGIHELYIRDKNGCGITMIPFSILGHMKYFSPNGDGINDYWKILGVNAKFQPQSQIYIFDRYGRLITEIKPSEAGWDGKLNNRLLPQDDYWFRVFFQDGRQYSGHFSLLREP